MINVAMPSIPRSFDSTELMLATHFILLQCTCQTLVRINEKGAVVSDAASSWEFDSNGTVLTFRLNPTLKYSDGTNATAGEFAANMKRHLSVDSRSAIGGYLRKVLAGPDSVSAPNNATVQFNLAHRYSPFLHLLAMPGFCLQKRVGDTFVGTGPLQVAKQESSFIKLIRNPHYKGDANLHEINVRAVPQLVDSPKTVDWSKVDLATGVSVNSLESHVIPGFRVTGLESLAIAHLYFNIENRPDLQSRERSFIKNLLSNLSEEFRSSYFEPLEHFLPRGVLPEKYYSSKVSSSSVSKVHPKILKPIRIKLLGSIFGVKFADKLTKLLSDGGIPNKVERQNQTDFLDSIRTGNYDMLGSSYTLNFPDADSVLDTLDPKSALRLGRFPTELFTERIAKARSNNENKIRLDQYVDALLKLEAENYIIPLFKLRVPIVHREELVLPSASFRYESELWKVFWKGI